MVKKHPPIKHIWFDFAGTLYRETPDLRIALRQFAYTLYAQVAGITDIVRAKKEYEELYRTHGSHSACFRSLGKSDNFWQNSVDYLDRTVFFSPEEEVRQTLKKLHDTLPISLFTNFTRNQITGLLEHLQIPESEFTFILSGDDVSGRKPELGGFYKIIELSQLPANELVYVGDREAVDIIPAQTVGLQTCLLYGQGVKTVADYAFDSFSDLLSLVRV